MGQQTGSGTTPLDRTRRQRRLADRLAARARHARAHDAVHDEAARDVLQFLGDILPERLQCAAALAAGIPRRQHLRVARQIGRERFALWLGPGFLRPVARRGLACLRRRDLFLFQTQVELVQGLGGRPEPVPTVPCKLMLELLDLQRLGLHQSNQIDRCLAQFGGISGQGRGVFQHGYFIAELRPTGNPREGLSC